jgi:S-adenosylmethionine-dependent methyltransferase
MFYNANGFLMHNMVAGNFDYVQVGMPKKKKRTLSPDYPRDPQQVYGWLEEHWLADNRENGRQGVS